MRYLLLLCLPLVAQVQTPLTVYQSSGTATGEIRLQERRTNGTNHVGLAAPQSVAADLVWTLPATDGTNGQSLVTNGSGVLSWGSGACANCFINGGNSFGAAATLGTNDAQPLNLETSNATRWQITAAGMLQPGAADTYDIGDLSSARVRGVYAQIVDTAKSGGTGDYIETRKLQLFDNTGSTTAASFWDLNVVMSGAGAFQESYFYMRDNGGTNVFQSERIRSGVAVDRTFWYTDLLPDTTGGQALGSSTYRWGNTFVGILDASSSNTLVPNGTASLGASGNDWNRLWVGGVEASSFVRPQVDGGATSGSASKQWSATYTQALTASGATYLQTTGIGEASPSKGLLSVYGHNGYAYTPYNQVVSARFRTGANSAILFGTTVANTSGWTRGMYWTYQTEDLAFTRFKDDETAAPVVDMYVSASGLVGIGTASVTEELTVNGSIDVIGSGAIEIAGTTVIDASRNATVANLTITGTCTGCSGLPATDTSAIVKGSADATKLLRFEVDGFTTATTRVLTPQNSSYTIAGTDIGQTFTGAQTFNNTVTVNAQSWVTSGNSFVLDRATRGTNQKIYWTVGASTSVDGSWSAGTTPSGAASRWVVDHKGTEHLVLDESGLLTTTAGANFNGIVSTTTFNATGSPAYRVSGITVIDASRNASIVGLTLTGSVTGDISPSLNNTYLLGSGSFRWSNVYTNNFNISGNITGDMIPATSNLYTNGSSSNYWNMVRTESIRTHGGNIQPATTLSGSLGASTGRWLKTWTQDLDITGTVVPPSGTAFSGTKTVRAAGGGSDCTLTFSAGIMTGGTC